MRHALTVNAALRSAWESAQRPISEALAPVHDSLPAQSAMANAVDNGARAEQGSLSIGEGCLVLELRAANRNLRARLAQRQLEVEKLRSEHQALQDRLAILESGHSDATRR